jgi:hypothetical protein
VKNSARQKATYALLTSRSAPGQAVRLCGLHGKVLEASALPHSSLFDCFGDVVRKVLVRSITVVGLLETRRDEPINHNMLVSMG